MSPFKSSSSLRNSVYSYSFAKQSRFGWLNNKNFSDNLYTLPDSKCKRYTSQGFGNKINVENQGGKGSPAPNSYKIRSCFEDSSKKKIGPTILEKFSPMVIYFISIIANTKILPIR